ncbi:MAG: DUF1292 domain-containing protein [Clostridia bacterium]|nr:DUF1292 domain-containing protein [Clostridia bacterium]
MNNENNMDDIVTLYDEDGKETDYVVVEGIEYNGKCYLALVEAANINDEECEFIILRMDDDDSEEGGLLSTIEDEDEFNAVMEAFDAKLDEEYDLEVEDGIE